MPEGNGHQQFGFGINLQKRILSMMLCNTSFLIQANRFLKSYHFTAEVLRWFAAEILQYYAKYRLPMSADVVAEKIKWLPTESQLEYTRVVKEIYQMKIAEDIFIKDALREFIQRNVFIRGWEAIAAAYNAGQADEAFTRFAAVSQDIKGVEFSPPDRSFFFKTYGERKEKRAARSMDLETHTFPTAIPQLDEILQGGLKRGEVGMLYADAKIGKSIGLNHMGFSCARMRSGRVCHFVLEGSREQAEDRYDARFAEFNYYAMRGGHLDPNLDKTLNHEYAQLGNFLVVEGMTDAWDYTVEDLEGKLTELESEGFVADMLVVDYGDLLLPRKETENKYTGQEAVFRDLKTLAQKAYRGRGVAIWTASQIRRPKRQGRAAHPSETDPKFVWTAAEIADSYAKIRIVDVAISLNQTDDEKRQGKMRLFVSDARDYEAKKLIEVKCDFTRMIFNTNKIGFQAQTNQQFRDANPWLLY